MELFRQGHWLCSRSLPLGCAAVLLSVPGPRKRLTVDAEALAIVRLVD